MEYTIEEYKRTSGNIFCTPDGKYVQSKHMEKYIYLKCAIFRTGCRATSRLNRETNLITPLKNHDHSVDLYKTQVYQLKTKCKSVAKNSQTNLRMVFDDVTRRDPGACHISFPECESSMYRARRMIQPKIPLTANKFIDMLPTTPYMEHFKFAARSGDQIAAVFYSEQMSTFLAEVTNVQFDGTFFTVPKQFFQLWSIFFSVGCHSLPAMHCLMSSKSQDLYIAILEKIANEVPLFRPLASMSDWEPAARNAFKAVYPEIKMYGCWFHYTQRIWAKAQKLGLSQEIPFLPEAQIYPTASLLQIPTVHHSERSKLEKLQVYLNRRWLRQVTPQELSIYDLTIATNNAALVAEWLEHSSIKLMVVCSNPISDLVLISKY